MPSNWDTLLKAADTKTRYNIYKATSILNLGQRNNLLIALSNDKSHAA
jgi:hypothetical protein